MASETGRIEAFSDGIFGIAATLLILEIKVPPVGQDLARGLLRQWPSYFSFFLSFIFIGIMWINHHRLFNYIRRADDGLLMLNMLLLLGIVFVPYPTSVLALHLLAADARTAAILYNGTYLVVSILYNALWHYAVSRKLLAREHDAEAVRRISRQYAAGPLLYVICFLTTFRSVRLSLAINVAMAIYFTIPIVRTRRIEP